MVLLNGDKSAAAWRLQLHVTKHCGLQYEWGCLMGLAGVPSSDDIEAVHSQYAKTMMETMMQPHSNPNKLRKMFPDAPDDALDLMQKLLQFNPQKRLTAEEALQHPYVAHFHNPEDEPVAAGPITISVDDNKKVLFRCSCTFKLDITTELSCCHAECSCCQQCIDASMLHIQCKH